MSDKDSKPWEATFGQDSQANTETDTDLQSNAKYSRVQRKEQKTSNKVLVWSLALILLVIMCLPIAWSAISSGNSKSSVDHANQVDVSSKPKKAKSKPKKQKAKKVVSHLDDFGDAKDKDQSDDSQADSNDAADNSQSAAAEQTAPAATQSEEQASNYYVVQARDNAYRIALNHNMTTAELYQMNGLSQETVLRPGMRLKVK